MSDLDDVEFDDPLGAAEVNRACGYLRDGLGEAEVRQRLWDGLPVPAAVDALDLDLASVERDELLRVTGEYGQEPTARPGLDPAGSAAGQLAAATARIRWWAGRSADPLLDRETVRAARTVLRSYERLAHGAGRPGPDGEVVVG
ncbi:hypothetical protein [Frankia tisae]|uniref:hypothetical protein n=1 Tax=Frankia tisae TaxID=2950104 RepID=UPI0021C081B0|nr:hypothetical protein [Frankia tisae]